MKSQCLTVTIPIKFLPPGHQFTLESSDDLSEKMFVSYVLLERFIICIKVTLYHRYFILGFKLFLAGKQNTPQIFINAQQFFLSSWKDATCKEEIIVYMEFSQP